MKDMDRRDKEALDRHIEGDDSDNVVATLPLEQSNAARIQALSAIGIGLNGVNEALTLRMLERLLGPIASEQVKHEHNLWLADMLDGAEEQVTAQQQLQAEQQRRNSLLVGRKA